MASAFAAGCAFEAEGDGGTGELIAKVESAINIDNALVPNALVPNALVPNALVPNALVPNALVPNALPASTLTALRDTGEAGEVSRLFMRYVVSCAFDSTQSFTINYPDAETGPESVTFTGALGLATQWEKGGLSLSERRWVSACIAARTNYYGIPVMISLRGNHPSLTADLNERESYGMQEGAFWGDLFADTPFVQACYVPETVEYARTKLRECAAGHVDGSSTTACGMLERVGPCSEPLCTATSDRLDGFIACDGISEVISSFLN
jgi:hypothetical protein